MTVKESTLEVRSGTQPRKAIPRSRLNELSSATLKERESTVITPSCEYVLTPSSHILNAARHLRDLDQRQVDAVQARIESDLRTGYAFTRFLTTSLRSLGGPIQNNMISYGMFWPNLCPCYEEK